jgi:hypothetical protein
MNKRETLDRLNRLLLVVEGLPDLVDVVSIQVAGYQHKNGTTVHVLTTDQIQFTRRERFSLKDIRESVEIAGVEVFQLIDAPVPEGM